MEVTVSGVPKARRMHIQDLVERVRGTYSGALVVGRTAAVVVEGAAIDWAAPKLAAAQANEIPVVTLDWLIDSQHHGFLLCPQRYAIAPVQPARRSSAASTSAAGLGPPPESCAAVAAITAATPAAAVPAAAPQPAQQDTPRHKPAPLPAQPPTPASPELERLRGEAQLPPSGPWLPRGFFELPPKGERSSAGTCSKLQQREQHQGEVAADALPEQLPSPASVTRHRLAVPLDRLLPSPLSPWDARLQVPDEEEDGSMKGGGEVAYTPGLAAPAAGGPASGQGASAAPHAASASSSGGIRTLSCRANNCSTPGAASTDSDTKVARFLSRRPCVTLCRGGMRLQRGRLASLDSPCGDGRTSSSSSDSIGGGCLLGSLTGRGSAQRRESCSTSSCSDQEGSPGLQRVQRCMWAGMVDEGEEGALEQRREPVPLTAATITAEDSQGAADDELDGASSGLPAGDLQPAPPAILRRWYTESVMRMRLSLAESRLPATTLVRMGLPCQRAPARTTLEGIAERHRAASLAAEQRLTVDFHISAQALPESGTEMEFVAGDTGHGARMLYDILEDGRRTYALALVQSIYQLCGEAWMEHRYLLSQEELLERPAWAAALQGQGAQPGELFLSSGSYHSPMHLICGEFWLTFPGRAQRLGKGQSRGNTGAAAGGDGSQRQPAYMCRRGFDAAAGAMVPLRRALEGFAA